MSSARYSMRSSHFVALRATAAPGRAAHSAARLVSVSWGNRGVNDPLLYTLPDPRRAPGGRSRHGCPLSASTDAARDVAEIQSRLRAHFGRLFSAEAHLGSTSNSVCVFQSKTVRHASWFRVELGLRKKPFLTRYPCAAVSRCPGADACEVPASTVMTSASNVKYTAYGKTRTIARRTPSSMTGNWNGLSTSLAKTVLTCVSKRTPRPIRSRSYRSAASKISTSASDETSRRHIQRAVRRRVRSSSRISDHGRE